MLCRLAPLALALAPLIACTASSPEDTKKAAAKSEPAKSEPAKSEPAEPAKSEPAKPTREVLGLMQTKAGLTLQIHSGGCRKPADLAFEVTAGALALASISPDTCDMDSVLGVDLLFPWADLPPFVTYGIELGAAEVVEPGATPGPSVPPEGAKDEALYGVLVKSDGLDLRVSSGGCTAPEHFAFYVEPGEVQQVHVVRTKPDMCEAYLAEGELLHFTWAQVGVTSGKARVVNPFAKLIVK